MSHKAKQKSKLDVCYQCELLSCKCGQELTFYSIYSESLGNGPLHRTLEEAQQERDELLQEDSKDRIQIFKHKMKAEEFVKLPEHCGY